MLTDVEASAAQAADRDYKLADANGLYLFVTRSGFKSWRMKYRFGGKEKRLTFGAYPEVTLEEARERRDQARRLLRDNVDPALEKQRLRAAAPGGADEVLPLEQAGLTPPPRPAAMPIPMLAEEPVIPTPPPLAIAPGQAPPVLVPVDPVTLTIVPAEATIAPASPPSAGQPIVLPPQPSEPPRAEAAAPPPAATAPIILPAPSVDPAPHIVDVPAPTASASTPEARPAGPRPAAIGPTPRVSAADEPVEAVPFTPDLAAGSRALSLLRQAEVAAERAADQSRTAKRIASAMLLLFAAMAAALAWWLLAGHRAPAAVRVAAAAPVAAVAPAASSGPAPAAIPTPVSSPATPAPAAGDAGLAGSAAMPPAAPPATAAPAPPAAVSATTARARDGGTAAPSHRRRHRRHARHRRHRHHLRSAATARPATYSSTRSAATARPRHLSNSETDHAITVSGSRGDAIDPALDRAGRAALCLRAAYSALPGCAAVR